MANKILKILTVSVSVFLMLPTYVYALCMTGNHLTKSIDINVVVAEDGERSGGNRIVKPPTSRTRNNNEIG